MLTINDPQSWLNGGYPAPDPYSGKWTHEKLRVGDVTDKGDLVQADGTLLVSGSMVVTPLQADAAAYYGWKDNGLRVLYSDGLRMVVFRASAP